MSRTTAHAEARMVAPPQARTFAIGDLHGEITLLCRLLQQFQPTAMDTVIFLGDYVDRGEDSVAVCEELLRLRTQLPAAFIALCGNHDTAWLEVWTGTGYRACPVIPGAHAIWTCYHGAPPLSIGRFLETTVLTYEDAHGFYCHAGITPGKAPQAADEEVYLWGSGGFFTVLLLPYPRPMSAGITSCESP